MRHANKILVSVVFVAVLIAYGVAYLSLVERRVDLWQPWATAEYQIEGRAIRALFLPAHSVDRLIRSRYWTMGGGPADPYDYETFTK